jgi:hypothetical protein
MAWYTQGTKVTLSMRQAFSGRGTRFVAATGMSLMCRTLVSRSADVDLADGIGRTVPELTTV